MKELAALLGKELGIILLIGAVPIFYAFLWGGADIKEQFLLKLVVDSKVAWYVAACAVVFLVVAWIEHRFVVAFAVLQGAARFIIYVLLDSVLVLAGLLRIIAGMLLGFLLLSWFGGADVIGTIKLQSFAATAATSAVAGFVIARMALLARYQWWAADGASH